MGVPSLGDDLVRLVEYCQWLSEEWNNAWHKLCDVDGGGVHDPSWHAVALLQKFLKATWLAGRTGASVHVLLGVTPPPDLVSLVTQ